MEHRTRGPRRIRLPDLLLVLGVNVAAIAALFLGYEAVERKWLADIGPELTHTLHLIRGVVAAVLAAGLTAAALLRGSRQSVDAVSGSSEKSWQHRFQNVRLRTKIVVPMVALATLPTLTVGIFTISRIQEWLREGAIRRVEFDTASKARAIKLSLDAVQRDLGFLAQLKEVRELASAEAARNAERVDVLRRKVEQEFLIFSVGKQAYYQVRYISSKGSEVVRVNVEGGIAKVVPPPQLQNKSDRYYVQAALALEPGGIYVSSMDLNVENGKPEFPARGVVRYASSVFGVQGSGRGLLVINVYADYLLSLIGPLAPSLEAWLVDQEGAYLGYVGESEERRNFFRLEQRRRLSDNYTPEQCRAILGNSTNRLTVKTDVAFLSNAPIPTNQLEPRRHWTLMIGHPQDPIEAPIRRVTMFLSVVMTLVVGMAAILGVMVSDHLAGPIVRLQHATRTIAAGDLEKPVKITTGGEIEELGNDFNLMREQLRQAQGQLAAWNLELKREVDRQTEIVQQLQGGMSRADKLASIGQITAGVMHEVGNPLAAIKTKIQVAQQEESVGAECQGLLNEILDEVNRLAAFLRGFSRLARLGSYQDKEDVSCAEVAHSVIQLVAADLRRKGIRLRCEAAEDLPKIRAVADQLRHVLMNLILNAADASQNGDEIVVRIRQLPAPQGPESVTLDVIDLGSGISPEILSGKIWDPFFTTKEHGSGLGLAICRQIVTEHGGSIRIESELGKGTTASVTIPVCNPLDGEQPGKNG